MCQSREVRLCRKVAALFICGRKTFPGHSGFAAHRSLLDNGSGRQVRLFVQMDGLDQAKGAGFTVRSGFRPATSRTD